MSDTCAHCEMVRAVITDDLCEACIAQLCPDCAGDPYRCHGCGELACPTRCDDSGLCPECTSGDWPAED